MENRLVKSVAGITYLETIIALVLSGIFFGALSVFLISAGRFIQSNAGRNIAQNVIDSRVATELGLAFDASAFTVDPTTGVGSALFEAEHRLSDLSEVDSALAVLPQAALARTVRLESPNLKRVTYTLQWGNSQPLKQEVRDVYVTPSGWTND